MHPLAEFCVIPSAVTLASGKDARTHLNRLLTAEIANDQEWTKRKSLLCDLTGRIITQFLHADLGEQILLVHSPDSKGLTRTTLTSGTSWNEDVSFSIGDDAVHRIVLFGKTPTRVLLGLGIAVENLSSSSWTELGDSMVSRNFGSEDSAFEFLTPSRSLDQIIEALEINGANRISERKWNLFTNLRGDPDGAVLIRGNIPFELGLEKLVNLRKGCYPGQEIHARMESRGVLARKLIHLETSSPILLGKHRTKSGAKIHILNSIEYQNKFFQLTLVSTKLDLGDSINIISENNEIIANIVK